jgi:tetratricopeptide (TPR) repeat protein
LVTKNNSNFVGVIEKRAIPFMFLLIILFCFLQFSNTFNHELNLDDSLVFDQINELDDTFLGIFDVFSKRVDQASYRPISMLSFAIENFLFNGIKLPVAHFINILLFAINTFLVVIVLRFLLPVNNFFLVSLLFVLIFISHPIHSNVVSSLKNRDVLLSNVFGLLTALSFFKSFHSLTAYKSVLWALFGILMFVMALLSKLDGVNYIILIFLAYLLIFKKQTNYLKIFINLFLPSVVLGMVFKYILQFINKTSLVENPEAFLKFTQNPLINEPFSVKLFTLFSYLFYYLKFMLVPKDYHFYFGFDMIPIGISNSLEYILGIIIFALSITLIVIFVKKRMHFELLCFLFFWGSLVYSFGIISTPIAGIIAARFAFTASIGFCMLIAFLLGRFLNHSVKKKSKAAVVIVTGLILILFSYQTFQRNNDWFNKESLIEADMPKLERSFEANRIASSYYITSAYFEKDQNKIMQLYENGLKYSLQASKLYKKNIQIEESIGICYFMLGEKDKSLNQFNYVISNFDTTEVSWEMLGDIFVEKNLIDNALICYTELISISPNYLRGYDKLTGTINAYNLNPSPAIEYLKYRLKIDAKNPLPYLALSDIYLTLPDTIKATNYLFNAFDRGLPNKGKTIYLTVYFKKNNLMDLWNNFEAGYRMPID